MTPGETLWVWTDDEQSAVANSLLKYGGSDVTVPREEKEGSLRQFISDTGLVGPQ